MSQEDFPSLKHKVKSYKFTSDYKFSSKGKKVFIKTLDKHEWAGEIKLNNLVYFTDVERYCSDNQRVKEAIGKIRKQYYPQAHPDSEANSNWNQALYQLEKELGL